MLRIKTNKEKRNYSTIFTFYESQFSVNVFVAQKFLPFMCIESIKSFAFASLHFEMKENAHTKKQTNEEKSIMYTTNNVRQKSNESTIRIHWIEIFSIFYFFRSYSSFFSYKLINFLFSFSMVYRLWWFQFSFLSPMCVCVSYLNELLC